LGGRPPGWNLTDVDQLYNFELGPSIAKALQ